VDRIKRCNNRCIFCFVEQLPPNLRKSLYIKDDDFLLSFMYGNYITLTNLGKKDTERIIKSRLEPLYVSVHSLDSEIRKRIFQTDNHTRGLGNLKKLDDNGISMHAQIVLCPQINDGKNLVDTLYRLTNEYRSIKSVGIVPVGITRYNKNRMLKAVDKKNAQNTIDMVYEFNKKFKTLDRIFLSDEFYIIAGRSFPAYKSYYMFPQIENGIGKSRNFIAEFKGTAGKNILPDTRGVLAVTSEYGQYVFEVLKSEFQKFSLRFKVLAVKNNFLGGNVKVAGLLSGTDIIDRLKNVNLNGFRKILIPDSIFNYQGLTIDGHKKEDIVGKIDGKLIFTGEQAKNLIGELI